ncbi:arginine deiminase-related protein [Aliikangiella sp. IMCC44632]
MKIDSLPHLTNSVVMVKPNDFGYNPETGVDNEFQNKPSAGAAQEVTQLALNEFDQMVNRLIKAGIEVIVLDDTSNKIKIPDAVFPNNWFSTTSQGDLIIYPMKTDNRRAEVKIQPLSQLLSSAAYQINQTIDLRHQLDGILEGTGSMVFHHPSKQLFAAISERCEQSSLLKFSQQFGYQLHSMLANGASGAPIYHTNVVMSCGEDFAVVASPTLVNESVRQNVLEYLNETVTDVIEISQQQMSESFCGNIIQLKTAQSKIIAMSESALQGFSPQQRKTLEKHGELVSSNISTIEHIGGGSARCMIAENFLPLKECRDQA